MRRSTLLAKVALSACLAAVVSLIGVGAAEAGSIGTSTSTLALQSSKVAPQGNLTLHYSYSCPTGVVADLSVDVAQVVGGAVTRGQSFRTVACTGRTATATLTVSGNFAGRSAVVQADLAADRELGSWASSETVLTKTALGKTAKRVKRVTSSAVKADSALLSSGVAKLDVTAVAPIAKGAALKVTGTAACPAGKVAQLFTTVGGLNRPLPSATALTCTGSPQTVRTVVLVDTGAPVTGTAGLPVEAQLGNCAEEQCFNVSDSLIG